MVRQARWPTFEDWRDHGVEQGYDERNRTSLSQSTNKEERSWHARGAAKKWVGDFEFVKRKRGKKPRWFAFEDWRDYGVRLGYEGRNPGSLEKSDNNGERSWYRCGTNKKWVTGFDFARHNHSPLHAFSNSQNPAKEMG